MAQIYRWIAPDRKSKKKGATRLQVRVVEYTIDSEPEPQTYRLITSLVDSSAVSGCVARRRISSKMCVVENTIDELKTHLLGRKTPIRSLKPRQVVQEIYGWLLGHCPKALAR